MPKLDALRAATTVSASLLAREREIGRLRPGYAPDAVVVGANPLDDRAALDGIRLIVAGGWITREGGAAPLTTAPPVRRQHPPEARESLGRDRGPKPSSGATCTSRVELASHMPPAGSNPIRWAGSASART